MKVAIHSREDIETLSQKPFGKNTALISITDSDVECDYPTLTNQPKWILKLRFDDVIEEEDGYQLITDEQADTIADFVELILNKAKTLICQCEYGESRSAAIAAAVLEFTLVNGILIFADERYCPNKTVFHKVLKSLRTVRK